MIMMSLGFCQQFNMREIKQLTGQNTQTAARLACQSNSWRNVNIKPANQTSNSVQFNCKWTIKTDSLKHLRVTRIMRPFIWIYSCPVVTGVSGLAQKELVDGNAWCATSVRGDWRDWLGLQNTVYSCGRHLPLLQRESRFKNNELSKRICNWQK